MTCSNFGSHSARAIQIGATALIASALVCGGTGMAADTIFAHELGPETPGRIPFGDERLRPDSQAEDLRRGGWIYSAIGRLDFTFTDNAYLSTTNKVSDFVIAPTAVFGAHKTGLASVFDANVEVAYDFYGRATDLNGPRINGIIDGTIRFKEDMWSVRARAATNLQPSTSLGLVPATSRTIGGNQIQVLTYGISPGFLHPVTDTILAEARYEVSSVMFIRAPSGGANVAAGDSILQTAQAGLSNRNARAPLTWNLTGYYDQRSLNSSTGSSRRGSGEAGGEYHVSPRFALLAKGGYEWFDEPTLSDRLTGPYGLGGVLFRPTPRSNLRLEAGYRYRKPNYLGELQYSRSPRLTVSASFSQGVDTSQGALDSVFARAVRDIQGNLIDPLTGFPPVPTQSPFDFTDQAFRYTRLRIGLYGTLGRNYYNVSGSHERRSAGNVHGDSWAAEATLGRELTRTLTATIEGRYAKTTSPALIVTGGPHSETTSGSARLTYRMSKTLSGSLRYAHLRQSTTLVNYRENAIVLSFSKSF